MVHNAKFKKLPDAFKVLTAAEIEKINTDPASSEWMPAQEKGIRAASALPYELYAGGKLAADKQSFEISFEAGNKVFGKQAAGGPFNVYLPGKYLPGNEQVRTWSYAVKAGDRLKDTWPLSAFENAQYHLRVYGPNGFYREFTGDAHDPELEIQCAYQRSLTNSKKLTGSVELKLINHGAQPVNVTINDLGYHKGSLQKNVAARTTATLVIDLSKSHGWYDFEAKVAGGRLFGQRYAGRVETGKESFSDPVMGRV
jgi:phospholipase C